MTTTSAVNPSGLAAAPALTPTSARGPRRWLSWGVTRREAAVFSLMMLAVALAHGWNMFHFPYYENDEGTYMAQAQSLIEYGRLAPYTYWYDHAPGGWILIGLWAKLTGGFHTFGFSINSGRMLMLVLHLASSALLYLIVRKITGRPVAALIAVAVFSFGGNGIYFQRRVLLDNIAVFWMLAAVAALVYSRTRLTRIALAGLLLGVALMTKETIVFLAPVLAIAAVLQASRGRRLLASLSFTGMVALPVACYALLAVLKGELFPSGSALGGDAPHVSLLETLLWQAGRPGGSLFDSTSTIRNALTYWTQNDTSWMILAAVVTAATAGLLWVRPQLRLGGALLLAYWAYLLRGGLVIPFYVAPLYALVGLSAGILSGVFLPRGKPNDMSLRGLLQSIVWMGMGAVLLVGFAASARSQNGENLFASDQTTPQIEAVEWLLERPDAGTVAIDNYAYIELHEPLASPELQAEYYWKLDLDPEVQLRATRNDPANVSYMLVTPQMSYDMKGLPFTRSAFELSEPVAWFEGDGYPIVVTVNRGHAASID